MPDASIDLTLLLFRAEDSSQSIYNLHNTEHRLLEISE
jgi:hypothetical protein